MKRITLAFATILVALILTAGAVVSQDTARTVKAPPPQEDIPVTIVDKRNRPTKIESLPPESQAQVERARQAARSLLEPGSGGPNERIKVTVSCSHPPLKCTITVEF